MKSRLANTTDVAAAGSTPSVQRRMTAGHRGKKAKS